MQINTSFFTRESGRLPTQVSMGRPLAAVIFTSAFLGAGVSAVCFGVFGVFFFPLALFTGCSLRVTFYLVRIFGEIIRLL
jgi:hypothetical protein